MGEKRGQEEMEVVVGLAEGSEIFRAKGFSEHEDEFVRGVS